MRELTIRGVKTRIFRAGEPLVPFLLASLRETFGDEVRLEGTVLAVTSKILSLSENRLVDKREISKEALVRREADHFLGEIGYGCFLTLKHGLLIASAGIDESNSEADKFILYPSDPSKTAWAIRNSLAQEFKLKHFGVLVTDSHTSPLRAGVTGVTLAHAGFCGVEDCIGSKDLFGRKLQMTKVNVSDAMAAAAVFCMGEADESMPLAVISAPLRFTLEKDSDCSISPEQDLYAPLYKNRL